MFVVRALWAHRSSGVAPPIVVLCCAVIFAVSARASSAQETVNYASLSGRVVDTQGAVIVGARVSVRQTETNATAEAATGKDGRFRFPYLRVGRYELIVRQAGFADAVRPLTLTVGAAFDIPVTLSVEAVAANVTVTGAPTILEAARSQIAATVSQAEVEHLPMNGRNFLDLALLVPGVSPPNVSAHAAVRRNLRGAGRRPLGRQPAQLLQQLHRRRPLGQRRCGRLERHSVRRRRRRSVPGRDVGRPGGARTGARRLRQRRHQERHESCCAATSTATSATTALNARNALVAENAADDAEAIRRQPRRADRRRIARSTSPTSSSGSSISPAS